MSYFDITQYYFPITIIIVLFWTLLIGYLSLQSAYRWWRYKLPANYLYEHSKRPWEVFLYRLRVYGFRYITRRYDDTIFDVCLLIFIGLLLLVPRLLLAMILYAYRYITNKQRYVNIYNKWYKIYKFYSDIFALWFRPYFAVLFSKFGIVFEVPILLYQSAFVNAPYYVIVFWFKLFLIFSTIILIFIVIVYTWCIFHSFFTKNLSSFFSYRFPRLSLANTPINTLSTISEHKLKNRVTLPLYIKLKTLVGFQTINLWGSRKSLKLVTSDKQTNRYLKYLYNRRRRTGLPHFTQIKRLLKAPGWEIAVRFYDKCFMLKYIGTKHLSVNSGDFRSQILFPKVVSSRLNKNTNLFKNFFINKKVNVYKKKSNIYKKIEFSNYDNSKLIVPIGYNNQLPQLSTFFKNTFFKPNKSELVFLRAKEKFSQLFDHRFLCATSLYKQRRLLPPRFFSRSNYLLNFNYSYIFVEQSLFTSIFLRKNNLRILKKKTSKPLTILKMRKLFYNFRLRLSYLIRKTKLGKRLRKFESNLVPKLNHHLVHPKFIFDRNRILLYKLVFFFKKTIATESKLCLFKRYYGSSHFLRFFYTRLKKRRHYNALKHDFFFLRPVYNFNSKLLINLKLQKKFRNVCLISTRLQPWWFHYKNLVKNNLLQTRALTYPGSYENKDKPLLINLGVTSLVNRKLTKRIGGFYHNTSAFLYHHGYLGGRLKRKTLFKQLRRRIYRKSSKRYGRPRWTLFRRLFHRNFVRRFRYFFDFSLYNKGNDLKRFFSINVGINIDRKNFKIVNFFALLLYIYLCFFDNFNLLWTV